jgi:type I restriction enzyme S subunit
VNLNLDRSTWKRVAFGDVVRNLNVTVKDPELQGIERVIAMEHLNPGELKIARWGDIADGTTFTRRVRPGQTLFGKRRAYQRKAAYADFDAICSGDILVFEADPTQILPEFLPFLVQSDGFYDHALGTSAGSLSPRTNWRDLSNYEFDLPPLGEQKRIADLLWAAERHRQMLGGLECAARGLAQQRTAAIMAILDAKSLVPTTEVIDEMTVGVVVRPTQYYTDADDGIPALRGLNVLPGGFNLEDLVRFDPASAAALKKSTVREGDVVIVRTGRPGDAAVVTSEIAGYNCIDLIIARPGKDLDPHFLVRLLNSEFGSGLIEKHSAGTAQQHFNVGALKKLRIPCPDLAEQRALTAEMDRIDEAEAFVRAEREKVDSLVRSVLSLIF